MHLSGTTDTTLQLQTGLCEIRKSRHHFIFSLSPAQIYQWNCISSARGKKWVKYWFQRLSTHWYYLPRPCSAHWRFGGDIVPHVFFSLLWAAVLGSDYSSIHNCLAPLITDWNGPHVVCQVSIVVSQGLNTVNNLISTSAPFVHVENESQSRQFVSSRARSAFTRFSLFFSPPEFFFKRNLFRISTQTFKGSQ